MGYYEIGKEVRIINFKGNDKVQRLTEFLNYVYYFDTKAIVLADGHSNIKECIEDLRRGKLNFHDLTRNKGKEFEDLFPSSLIVKSMKNLSNKNTFIFEMSEEDLDAKRSNTNAAKVLESYMISNNGIELDKVSLAKEMCLLLSDEVKENDEKRQKTEFENEIESIVKIIRN
jgi:hypothetical protein